MLKITFQLHEHAMVAFDHFATLAGGRSQLVRHLVGELLAGRIILPRSEDIVTLTQTRQRIVELRLTDEEAEGVAKAAEARDLPPSKWIRSLIRRRLGSPGLVGRSDRMRLRSLDKTLHGLKTEIRRLQVELKVKAGRGEPPAILDRLEAIEAELARLGESVRASLDGAEHYWDSEEPAQRLALQIDKGAKPVG